jgi:hypothetical protein
LSRVQSTSSSQPVQTVFVQLLLRHSPALVHGSPVGFPQTLSESKQIAERHFASSAAQSDPLRRPQRSSISSHTPERHVRVPFAMVQLPSTGGTGASGWPFGVFGTHTICAHHSFAVHWASVVHAVPHAPSAVLQTGPGCVPTVQSASAVHFPHVPPG